MCCSSNISMGPRHEVPRWGNFGCEALRSILPLASGRGSNDRCGLSVFVVWARRRSSLYRALVGAENRLLTVIIQLLVGDHQMHLHRVRGLFHL